MREAGLPMPDTAVPGPSAALRASDYVAVKNLKGIKSRKQIRIQADISI